MSNGHNDYVNVREPMSNGHNDYVCERTDEQWVYDYVNVRQLLTSSLERGEKCYSI